jgi:hypothetical protein
VTVTASDNINIATYYYFSNGTYSSATTSLEVASGTTVNILVFARSSSTAKVYVDVANVKSSTSSSSSSSSSSSGTSSSGTSSTPSSTGSTTSTSSSTSSAGTSYTSSSSSSSYSGGAGTSTNSSYSSSSTYDVSNSMIIKIGITMFLVGSLLFSLF